jgi:hypothetical protein
VPLRSTPEAPSNVQARAALAVLLVAALLRRGAATFGPGSALSWLGTSPMAAWLSGWALGFASMKALRELGESFPGFIYLNLAVSLLATAMSALIILVFRPSTIVMGCYGAHATVTKVLMPEQWRELQRRPSRFDLRAARNAEHWAVQPLEELWTLSSRSLSVMVMMLWGFTVKQLLISGIDLQDLVHRGNIYHRLLFLWAMSLTAVCGLATVHCVRLRRRLTNEGIAETSSRSDPEESPSKSFSSPDARGPDAPSPLMMGTVDGLPRLPRLVMDGAEARMALEGASPLVVVERRARAEVHARINRRTALCELLMLFEQTCGWIIGVAWTDFVIVYFETTELPTVVGALEDLGVALLLTILGVCWLANAGYSSTLPQEEASDSKIDARSVVERFYLNSALSFFVGWMWITFLRDLTILCTFTVRPYFESGRLTCHTLQSGSNLCSDSSGENAVYVTAAVSMFLFSGLLTWALLRFSLFSGAANTQVAARPWKSMSLWRRRPKACCAAVVLSIVAAGALLHHLRHPAEAVPLPPPATLAPPPPPPPPWVRSGERGRGHGGAWADPPPPPPTVAPRAHERLRLVSWNMGSLDNSPFGHWRGQGKNVLALMTAAHAVLLDPARDVRVGEIFTDSMWVELREEMRTLGWAGINETDALWRTELSHRPAYQGFVMGRSVAEKKLVAMADRYTNTLHTTDLREHSRPSAVSCYSGNLSSVPQWWAAWRGFMFHNRLEVPRDGDESPRAGIAKLVSRNSQTSPGEAAHGAAEAATRPPPPPAAAAERHVSVAQPPAARLYVMRSARYPKISAFEEAISVALQALSLALFDAALVHLLNSVRADWQQVQRQVCRAVLATRQDAGLRILNGSYASADAIFLQETAPAFPARLASSASTLARTHLALVPPPVPGRAEVQTAALLLRRRAFVVETVRDHTSTVLAALPSGLLDPGDLLVAEANGIDGQARPRRCIPAATPRRTSSTAGSPPIPRHPDTTSPLHHVTPTSPPPPAAQAYLFACFHGEEHTNGAGAVLNALNKLADGMPAHRLVLALDADTHVTGGPRRHREEPHSQTGTALTSERDGTVPRCVAQAVVAARGVAAPLPPPCRPTALRRPRLLLVPFTTGTTGWHACPSRHGTPLPPTGRPPVAILGGGVSRGRVRLLVHPPAPWCPCRSRGSPLATWPRGTRRAGATCRRLTPSPPSTRAPTCRRSCTKPRRRPPTPRGATTTRRASHGDALYTH